jgi:hypothetical protein
MSTISSLITKTVYVGVGSYAGPLVITATGVLAPTSPGAAALVAYPAPGATGLMILNEGRITGAHSGPIATSLTSNYGGIGVKLGGTTTFTNAGTITGGEVSASSSLGKYNYPAAGPGVYDIGFGASLINTGTIIGGRSDNAGAAGTGVDMFADGKIENRGKIIGGSADGPANSSNRFIGGGAGADVEGGTFTNYGVIVGGTGYGVSGGPGAYVRGGVLVNEGTLIGGHGAYLYGQGARIQSGTLITSGLIAEAPQRAGTSNPGIAVNVSGGTLVVEAGARFIGVVAGSSGGELDFGGSQAGTVGHIGTEFTNFGQIDVAQGSTWSLDKANTIAASTNVLDFGTLRITGLLQDAGLFVAFGALDVASGAAARVADVLTSGGTVAVNPQGRLTVGASLGAAQRGALTVGHGSEVCGYGLLVAPSGVIDNGVIIAGPAAGSLTLMGNVSGIGLLQISAGTTLAVDGNLSAAKLAFLAPPANQPTTGGTLVLTSTQAPTTVIQGFAGQDRIVLSNISATAFTFNNGTLTLNAGTQVVDTLKFAGEYTANNFVIFQSPGVGENITYSTGIIPPATSSHLAFTDRSSGPHPEAYTPWADHLVV